MSSLVRRIKGTILFIKLIFCLIANLKKLNYKLSMCYCLNIITHESQFLIQYKAAVSSFKSWHSLLPVLMLGYNLTK